SATTWPRGPAGGPRPGRTGDGPTVLTGALAHVKWFTDPAAHPTQYQLLLTPPVLAAFAIALAATAVAWWIQHHIAEPAVFRGPGSLSLDRRRGVKPPFRGDEVPLAALTLLRVAMGFGIAYGALTEKLLDPPLGLALLAARPEINVFRGFGVGDPVLVYTAGVV